MLLPHFAQIYSLNEANSPDWDQGLQQYVQDMKQGNGKSGQRYSSRYIGSMVGDVHRYACSAHFWCTCLCTCLVPHLLWSEIALIEVERMGFDVFPRRFAICVSHHAYEPWRLRSMCFDVRSCNISLLHARDHAQRSQYRILD